MFLLEALTSLAKGVTTAVNETAGSVSEFSGLMGAESYSWFLNGAIHAEAIAGFAGGEAGDMIDPRLWLQEDQNRIIQGNIYASLPGTEYDPDDVYNAASGGKNR
ncbi:MAG: hypothetical protein GY804_03485 [Alphaproteobacteria bacterium]|nr:hypothetical protein [Alphaproteobacteria bacterium]